MNGQRLRQLRLARGLSLDALVAEMGGIVTKQSLSKYEQGKAHPTPKVLSKLAGALKVKSAYLWSEPTVSVQLIAYRKRSRLPQKERTRIENLIQHRLEARVRLQSLIVPTDKMELPIQKMAVKTPEEAEEVAAQVRRDWSLGMDPIASVTGVLEDHHVHVLEVDAGDKFDGISAAAYDQDNQVVAAAVVTRRGLPGERQRLDLAHELGHLLMEIPPTSDEEKAAYRFGAAFLAPASAIIREVGTTRAFLQPQELLLLKRHFGISVQALLYRLRDLGTITETYYKYWCIQINRLGWRKQEPSPISPEQPTWLHQNVLRALSEGVVTKEEAEAMVGEELQLDLPMSLIQRRAFMRLPLDERRRLMAEQAEKLTASYEEDQEWKDLGGGDVLEY